MFVFKPQPWYKLVLKKCDEHTPILGWWEKKLCIVTHWKEQERVHLLQNYSEINLRQSFWETLSEFVSLKSEDVPFL